MRRHELGIGVERHVGPEITDELRIVLGLEMSLLLALPTVPSECLRNCGRSRLGVELAGIEPDGLGLYGSCRQTCAPQVIENNHLSSQLTISIPNVDNKMP